jgi:ribosome-binding factor A
MIPFSRADRVSGLIQEVLSELLKKKIRDPRLAMATITSVKLSRDLKLARIYFTIYGDSEKSEAAAQGFKSALGFIKRNLARRLGLRYMPELKFFYDESFEYGSHIDQLLEKIATENEPDLKSN